jgi:aspartate aminotransferase
VQRLNAIPGITSNTPRGAFYIFPNIAALFGRRANGKPLTTAAEVADYLLDAAGVAVVPGDAFGDDHYMRISYASSMAELEDGLARIDQAVQQLA